jgi:hypothetical protein
LAAFEQPGLSAQELRECSAESEEAVLRSTDTRFCAKSQLSRFAVWKARKDAFWASGRQTFPYQIMEELPVILEELKKSLLPGVFSTNRRLIGQ